MSLLNLIGDTVDFTIGNETVKVKPFTITEIAKLQQYINDKYYNPLKDILPILHTLPPETKVLVMREIKTYKPPEFGTPEAEEFIQSFGCLHECFKIAVKVGDPKRTDEEINRIAESVPFNEFIKRSMELMLVLFGISEETDPKAESQEKPLTGKE